MPCERNLLTGDPKLPTNAIARRQLMMEKTQKSVCGDRNRTLDIEEFEITCLLFKLNGLSECQYSVEIILEFQFIASKSSVEYLYKHTYLK